jgi:hypothetical protein
LYNFFAGHRALNHLGQAFDCFYFLVHMYSSIAGHQTVSMACVAFCAGVASGAVFRHTKAQLFQPWDVPAA